MDINRICSFKACENTSLNRKDCCFYEFPVDFNLCLQWVENVGNKDFFEDFAYGGAVPFRRKYICSDHFGDHDFVDSGNIYAGIKPTAIPCYTSARRNVSEAGPLSTNILVKAEPSEKEFWDPGEFTSPIVFPVEFLETVKVEEISSQSVHLEGIDSLQSVNFHVTKKSRTRKAESMANKRSKETGEERIERLRKNAERAAFQRSIESEEQTVLRRCRNAQRNAIRRSLENSFEKEKRRKRNAERQARRRQNETSEQREIRRMKDLLRARRRRLQETDEQARIRRSGDAARAQARRQNESEEEKNTRRISDIIRITNRRKNESPEERKERLRKNREYSAKRRYIQKLECELTHPKDVPDDSAMNFRNFEEDVTSMNVSFFQSLGIYAKSHEYHYIREVLSEKGDCHSGTTNVKFLPIGNSFEEYAVEECSQVQKASCVEDQSVKEPSELSLCKNKSNIKSQLVLL